MLGMSLGVTLSPLQACCLRYATRYNMSERQKMRQAKISAKELDVPDRYRAKGVTVIAVEEVIQ